MRFLIFGAGAVGQALGCMLSSGGHQVDLIVRERYLDTLQSGGLAVSGIFGEYHSDKHGTGYYTSVGNVLDSAYDYALITTKSYDTDSAISELKKLNHQNFFAVSMQNGCGNIEKLIGSFGHMRSLAARVITGFEIVQSGHVTITVSADAVHIGGSVGGEMPEPAKRLAKALNKSGLPAESTPFIRRDLYAKLLYNSALNPMGAALGVHYGALGDDPNSRAIMSAVIREVFTVIKAMGGSTNWETAEEYESFFYGKQIPATYNHRSSMLQDIEKGKQTEVEALTGYVSFQGRKYRVPTPVCDTLTALIRFLEKIP